MILYSSGYCIKCFKTCLLCFAKLTFLHVPEEYQKYYKLLNND